MQLNPKTDSIIINWYGIPCHCHCKHCLLGYPRRVTGVPFDRAKKVAEKYAGWVRTEIGEHFPIGFSAGYANDSKESLAAGELSRQLGMFTGSQTFLSGSRFREKSETRQLFQEIKKAGCDQVFLTFRGIGDAHDKQVGRLGDFDYLMSLAGLTAEMGLKRVNGVLIIRETIHQLPELISRLTSLPGSAEWCVGLIDHRGNAKNAESDRVSLSDIKALPKHIRSMINLNPYLSEAEWVEYLHSQEAPERIRRCFMISIWDENIDELEQTCCADFLQQMHEQDLRFHQSIPSLPELAALYGDRQNERLYTVRDLDWKWTDHYLKDHPEVDPIGRFDDTETCILWQYPRTSCSLCAKENE